MTKKRDWERRKNFKIYTNQPVPEELELKLDYIINACPIQRHDKGYVKIFKCTQDDLIVKEKLSRWVFRNEDTGLNELAPITAPLVYFCCSEENEHYDIKHACIIGGALMSETLSFGFDFSFIGCTSEVNKKQLDYINVCLQERFGVQQRFSRPYLAFCIGKGDPVRLHKSKYKLHDGGIIHYRTIVNQSSIPPRLFF